MAPLTPNVGVEFGIVALAVASFILKRVLPPVTALFVMVSLVVRYSWTTISADGALEGVVSHAVITIIGTPVPSEGVNRTGVDHRLGHRISRWTRGDQRRLLGATIGNRAFWRR